MRNAASGALMRRSVLWVESPHLAETLIAVGGVNMKAGKPEAARALIEEALGILAKRLRPDHPKLAWAQAQLAQCRDQLEHRPDAAVAGDD